MRAARHPLWIGLATFLYLTLQVLAVSPELHHALHEDSHRHDHQCAVQLLSDGQVDVAPGGIGLALPTGEPVSVRNPRGPLTQVNDFCQPPGRAPPVVPA